MTHYHVMGGLSGGYLPDWNQDADTYKEARSLAVEEVEQYTAVYDYYNPNSAMLVSKLNNNAYIIDTDCSSPTSAEFLVEISEPCYEDCHEGDDAQ